MMPAEEAYSAAGLYVHIPFCASICPYCDFAVLIAGRERRARYLDAIPVEAALYGELGLPFDTVYLGGGTPSSLEPDQLGVLLDRLRRRLRIDPDAWLTLEVNPEDVTTESAREWRALGFRTVSLGAQSLDDRTLGFLGRRHTGDHVLRAIGLLRGQGFHTVSVDLICGLPGQTPQDWRRQLEAAARLEPQHLSCYQLTVHDRTVFGRRRDRGELSEAPDELQAELFLLTHAVLADSGYDGYEVANFALGREHRSRHNLKYWSHTPYLGLGPSAHSFAGRRRWWNQRKLRLWQHDLDAGRAPTEGDEWLGPEQLAFELVMLGLRTADGVDLERLLEGYGVDLVAANRGTIDRLSASGHLVHDRGRLHPTVSGMMIADSIARSLEIVLPERMAVAGPISRAGNDDGIVDRIATPDGRELALHHRDGVFSIRIDGLELVSSRGRRSEEALAELGCGALGGHRRPAVLVAGLGMGFTLRAALDLLASEAEVVVAELFAPVVDWNRGPLAEAAGVPLLDQRVRVEVADVYDLLSASPSRWDLILLDVDNGPGALSVGANRRLYQESGVRRIRSALRPGGVLAVWSAAPDAEFHHRLSRCGFAVEALEVRVHDAVVHTVYLGRTRPASPSVHLSRP